MGTTPIQSKIVLITVAALMLIETLAAKFSATSGPFSIGSLGILRVIESGLIISIVLIFNKGLKSIGLDRERIKTGINSGVSWSLAFAMAAGVAIGFFYILEYNPLNFIRVPLPHTNKDLALFFLVGGLVAPIAEEIFFRGILFGYFSRWGTATAVILSTIIFVAFHFQAGITQAVGGVVFALAYHCSGSIVAPILIHSLGNLALFSISLLGRYFS